MSLVQAASPKMGDLIDLNAGWTEIASGCMFTEGPLWVAAEGAFYFSDMPGDTRRKWTAGGGVEVVARPRTIFLRHKVRPASPTELWPPHKKSMAEYRNHSLN